MSSKSKATQFSPIAMVLDNHAPIKLSLAGDPRNAACLSDSECRFEVFHLAVRDKEPTKAPWGGWKPKGLSFKLTFALI